MKYTVQCSSYADMANVSDDLAEIEVVYQTLDTRTLEIETDDESIVRQLANDTRVKSITPKSQQSS